MNNSFFEAMKDKTTKEYLDLLCRAQQEPVIDGIRMPTFTDEAFQKGTVGSFGEDSLRNEGLSFYNIVNAYASVLNKPIEPNTKILDFGCGWGRMIRFYLKDIKEENIYGIDVDPAMIDVCKNTVHYGNYSTVNPTPPTNFDDNMFDIIFAYSVFSHLRDDVAEMWIKEFSRILKPNGLLIATTQGEKFLDLCEFYYKNPDKLDHEWHELISKSFANNENARTRYKDGEFIYAATGSGVRDASFYGEAIIPEKYIKTTYGKYLNFCDFNVDLLPQSLFVMQKPELNSAPTINNKLDISHFREIFFENTYDEFISGDYEYCIFGLGWTGASLYKNITSSGKVKIDYFCDNDPSKATERCEYGIPCISVEQASTLKNLKILIPRGMYHEKMQEQLQKLGFVNYVVLSIY